MAEVKGWALSIGRKNLLNQKSASFYEKDLLQILLNNTIYNTFMQQEFTECTFFTAWVQNEIAFQYLNINKYT